LPANASHADFVKFVMAATASTYCLGFVHHPEITRQRQLDPHHSIKLRILCGGGTGLSLQEAVPSNSIRLGNEFELDPDAYELRRAGQPLKLGRIPMELLLLLVEQRGRLVSRDQIAERIWGKNVFLDTDNSINAAIRKLRRTLGDDPDRPRFVQTVIGRGYRFVAAIDPADPVAAGKFAAGLQVGRETAIEWPTDRASEELLPSAPKRPRVTFSLGVALLVSLAVFLTVGAGGFHIRMFRRPAGNSHMHAQAFSGVCAPGRRRRVIRKQSVRRLRLYITRAVTCV
jgi:DNA-binding winged helix-turn-helix (wHTH) protein